jgi:transposase
LARDLGGARLVVVEATGGYELKIVRALQSAGVPVAVVNPRRACAFARASGRLAKTDRIDALVIVQVGRVMRPAQIPHIEAGRMALGDLVTRRRQVIDMVVAKENRLEHAGPAMAALISPNSRTSSPASTRRSRSPFTPTAARRSSKAFRALARSLRRC